MSKAAPLDGTPRYFFDISSVINYVGHIDRYSGIQRVVVTAIVELSHLIEPDRMFLAWHDRKTGHTHCLPFAELGAAAFASPASMRRIFRPNVSHREQLAPLKKYKNKPVKYYMKRALLDLQARLGQDKRFRKHNMTAQMWRTLRAAGKSEQAQSLKTQPLMTTACKGDDLVLLDSSWELEQMAVFSAARDAGLRVHTMVYDLIPIVCPEVCVGSLPIVFYDWLLKSADYTDHYMAISESTGRDLTAFFDAHQIENAVSVVPLAQASLPKFADESSHEMPSNSLIPKDVLPDFYEKALLESGMRKIVASTYVLCVGTIEPRKNVWRIALAWKALLEKGHTDLPKLVFAGGKGWLHDDFEKLLSATGNLYGYISVVDGPSDEELDILYRRCRFAIMASTYEGWGLPVGEALSYGKTCVVAHNSSLPEVGGDLVEYCDAHDVNSIVTAVERLLDPDYLAALEAKIEAADLREWRDVARDLLAVLSLSDAR